ncbi:MAG: hypothetical protein ABI867_01180 [Kofleriaceae bacterium]
MTNASSELVCVASDLRKAFADERAAIAALDHARLEALVETKRALAERLSVLAPNARAENRELFAALRIEAQATAMLAATANTAIRALLGYSTNDSYDRRARRVTTGPSRILAAY